MPLARDVQVRALMESISVEAEEPNPKNAGAGFAAVLAAMKVSVFCGAKLSPLSDTYEQTSSTRSSAMQGRQPRGIVDDAVSPQRRAQLNLWYGDTADSKELLAISPTCMRKVSGQAAGVAKDTRKFPHNTASNYVVEASCSRFSFHSVFCMISNYGPRHTSCENVLRIVLRCCTWFTVRLRAHNMVVRNGWSPPRL